jgi:integrase/recombinase XerC
LTGAEREASGQGGDGLVDGVGEGRRTLSIAAVSTDGTTDSTNAQAIVAAFLAGRNERTLRAYRQDLERFAAFLGAATPEEAAGRLLSAGAGGANALTLAYRAHLRDAGHQAASINRRLAALRSLVKLARMLGAVNWALEVPSLPVEPYRDTRGPGRDGFRRLLDAAEADADPRRRARDRAVLRLLYDLGLRRNEVATLDLSDLDRERSALLVLGKGRTGKTPLTLAPATRAALEEWLTFRGDAPGPLLTNFDRSAKGGARLSTNGVYAVVRRLGAAAGVAVSPHGLRHTAITEACKVAQAAGIGLEEVLDFSRHKDVSVLMIYRDRERNVQGRLAALVAETAEPSPPGPLP